MFRFIHSGPMAEKILIIDDDIDSLKLIGMMLQRHGYEVIAANAGQQGLAKATAELPNLIILDVMMPDMSGLDVCRRLRGNPSTKGIPIIMFTAKTMIDDKVAGFEAGADDYLTKPTHPAELASRVRSVLARSTPPPQPAPRPVSKGTSIGVIGAKGGVGVTTLALNLAVAYLQNEPTTIVADLRPGSGYLGALLGVSRAAGMGNVLSKPAAEIKSSTIEKDLVTHASGLRALLCSTNPREAQANYAFDTTLAVVRTIHTMTRMAVFDLGSSFTNAVSRLQKEMDKIVLVVEPNGVTLRIAQELLQELQTNSELTPIHIVVVNRTQSSQQTPWHEVEHILGKEIRAIISPAPELVFQASEAHTPVITMQPNAIISTQIMKLAEDLNIRIKSIAGGVTT